MSFSFEAKNELCKLPVQRLCCARAEAYGILLYCNTFSSAEVRIITGNPNLAARLPKLFRSWKKNSRSSSPFCPWKRVRKICLLSVSCKEAHLPQEKKNKSTSLLRPTPPDQNLLLS